MRRCLTRSGAQGAQPEGSSRQPDGSSRPSWLPASGPLQRADTQSAANLDWLGMLLDNSRS